MVGRPAGYAARGGFGKRPALAVIDVNYAFCGDRPEPILESIKRWRDSCGEDAWTGIAVIKKLLDACHAKGVPVIYTSRKIREDNWDAGGWLFKNSRYREDPPQDSKLDPHAIVAPIAPAPQDILSGIFGGDAAQLSARTVLPRLVEMEERIRLADPRNAGRAPQDARQGQGGAQDNGNERRKRQRALHAVDLHRHARRNAPDGGCPGRAARTGLGAPLHAGQRRWKKSPTDGRLRLAEKRSSTTRSSWPRPPGQRARCLAGWMRQLGEELRAIPYSSSITINLIYDEAKLGRLPDGFGFLVPASEGRVDAGLHLCPSQVPGPHAAGQGRAAGISGRHEKRGAAGRSRTKRWWPPCAAN